MIWITADDVIRLHTLVIQKTGGLDGLRDRGALESAVASPMQSFDGRELFKTDIEKISRIGFGLAANHAFVDGNKRIGALVTQLLLKWNGYKLKLRSGELADMFIAIAAGKAGEPDLREWILSHLE